MQRLLLIWLVNALALIVIAYIMPGIDVESPLSALVVALVLGLINAFIRPVLVILTLPITVLTLGLFTVLINGFIFWVVGRIIEGFDVQGFWWGVLGAVSYSILTYIGEKMVGQNRSSQSSTA